MAVKNKPPGDAADAPKDDAQLTDDNDQDADTPAAADAGNNLDASEAGEPVELTEPTGDHRRFADDGVTELDPVSGEPI